MSAQVKLARRNPGTPARFAAARGQPGRRPGPPRPQRRGGSRPRRRADPSPRGGRGMPRPAFRGRRSLRCRPPGSARRCQRHRQKAPRASAAARASARTGSAWHRIVTGTSGGNRLIAATERFRWPKPWLVAYRTSPPGGGIIHLSGFDRVGSRPPPYVPALWKTLGSTRSIENNRLWSICSKASTSPKAVHARIRSASVEGWSGKDCRAAILSGRGVRGIGSGLHVGDQAEAHRSKDVRGQAVPEGAEESI